MKKTTLALYTIILLTLTSACFAAIDRDFQFWNTESIEKKLNERLKIKFEEEFRYKDDAHIMYYNHSDIGLKGDINRYLSVGLNYRHIYKKKSDGHWQLEYTPHFNVTLQLKQNHITINDNNRLERRILKETDTNWRYRNKLSLLVPLNIFDLDISPYCAYELFHDLEYGKFTKDRAFSGIKIKLFRSLTGDVYYMQESTQTGGKTILDVLGAKLELRF